VWAKALQGPITFRLPKRNLAQRLRFQLYDTRKILQAKNDELFELIQFLSIALEVDKDKGDYTVTIGPKDAKLKTILEEMGFTGTSQGEINDKYPTSHSEVESSILQPEDDDLDPTK